MLNSRIIPYFSHFHVDKLNHTDIIQFYDLLSKNTQIVRMKNTIIKNNSKTSQTFSCYATKSSLLPTNTSKSS